MKILVVDDDRDMVDLLTYWLRSYGYDIVRAFDAARFDDLPEHCCDAYEMTDHPSAVLTLTRAGHSRRITHYHGNRSTPNAVFELEDTIDKLTGSVEWVGTPAEREELPFR